MAKKNNKNTQKPLSVGFVSLGCPKNTVDSESMLARIAQAGFLIGADPQTADVVIINSCGFIAPAAKESLDAVKQAIKRKKKGFVQKVIIAGCLSQRLGEDMFTHAPGIDAVVGVEQRDDIVSIIEKTMQTKAPAVFVDQTSVIVSDDKGRLLIGPQHAAYLRISEGCDHQCSFCTIPAIRGKFRSKKPQEILDEAKELVSAGVKELSIIAQDTGYYGKDLQLKNGLAELLESLQSQTDARWIRIMYIYPAGVTDKLIETIKASKKIVHYLDMPLQHINNDILKAMRRPDRKERIVELIEKLRKELPDIVLRTTLIVGFPGETDQQFEELLEFVKWARFDALGGFPYSPEQGTPAADMPNQISDKVKQQRLEKLMLCQQQIAFEKNKKLIGTEILCLIDEVDSGGTGKARYYGQALDIDSICLIPNCRAKTGDFIKAKVTASKDYDLIVKQI